MENKVKRGWIFQAWGIRAIIEGRKTMTRRIIEPQPQCDIPGAYFDAYNGGPQWNWWTKDNRVCNGHTIVKCPYQVGDVLWLRETWQAVRFIEDFESGYSDDWYHAAQIPKDNNDDFWSLVYRADDNGFDCHIEDRGFPWRSPMFMPKWASRIHVKITDIKAERVQDISTEDCVAEGIPTEDNKLPVPDDFKKIWNKINGPDAWERNEWVWCYTFERRK